jgi:hypothetical protein
VTFVLPSGNRLPDFGAHVAGTEPSRSSWAVTWNVARADFALFVAFPVLFVAPETVGGVVSNSSPGTISVPFQVARPTRPVAVSASRTLSTVPLPDAPV